MGHLGLFGVPAPFEPQLCSSNEEGMGYGMPAWAVSAWTSWISQDKGL